MPLELVMLSPRAVGREPQHEVAARAHVGGAYLEFDGYVTFVDDEGAILTIHDPQPIAHRAEASMAVGDVGAHAWWTEMATPWNRPDPGRALAAAIAASVGGEIRERG